jgi:hypothetical protein
MLLLTWFSITNQSSSFYFRIVYLHIDFGICFSTCQLDCLLVITNKSLYPIRDWSFVSQLLLTVFLFFNPCRTIQINCFQLIFNLPTAFESFRLILLSNLFRHVWSICSKPVFMLLLTFHRIFHPLSCIATWWEFLSHYR